MAKQAWRILYVLADLARLTYGAMLVVSALSGYALPPGTIGTAGLMLVLSFVQIRASFHQGRG